MKSNTGFYISRIKQINTRLLNKLLAQKNITEFNGEQGRILHVLWENDGISNQELSKRSGLAMSSLTTMLERMEEKNLLIRKGCPKDKRKCLLFLTEHANSLKKEYYEICHKRASVLNIFKKFCKEEREVEKVKNEENKNEKGKDVK